MGYNFGITHYKEDKLRYLSQGDTVKETVVVLERLYYKESSGYGIYDTETPDGFSMKVKGFTAIPLQVGASYHIEGEVNTYRSDKMVLLDDYEETLPTFKAGIVAFLQSLKGLYRHADLIYEWFKSDALFVVRDRPYEIVKLCDGVTPEDAVTWRIRFKQKSKNEEEHMRFLKDIGLYVPEIKRLMKEHTLEDLVIEIKDNPYLLSHRLAMSFERNDRIAMQLGFDKKSDVRIEHQIVDILSQSLNQGDCYVPLQAFRKTVKRRFPYLKRVESDRFIDGLIAKKALIKVHHYLSLPDLVESEKYVAKKLYHLTTKETDVFKNEVTVTLDKLLSERQIELEHKQREAVLTFARGEGGVFVLNGSAGCGKTFTLNIIAETIERLYKKHRRRCHIQLFAPTGKASKVASQATGRPCLTIHRGLGYQEDGFYHDERNPLVADVIVVDELSMIDIRLMKDLLRAITLGTKVIFMGDTKQLPSIGPGNVLKDMIDSRVVTVVTLNVVKRQKDTSGLLINANHIIAGEMVTSQKLTRDAYVMKRKTAQDIYQTIISTIRDLQRIHKYTFDDIQVLSAMKKGDVGVNELNLVIQKAFNKTTNQNKVLNKSLSVEDERFLYFKVGDKVIHTRNNKDKVWYIRDGEGRFLEATDTRGITNGEIGYIDDILFNGSDYHFRLVVRYEDVLTFYDDDVSDLDHAYALTIHKSQGSQWGAVIMPVIPAHQYMINNALLYTGHTRAKAFGLMLGDPQSMKIGIKNKESVERKTFLKERLRQKKQRGTLS